MARRAKDILAAGGFTDEEMAPWLSNKKFCDTLEAEAAAADEGVTHRAAAEDYKGKLDADLAWYNEKAIPTMKQLKVGLARAEARAAAAEAKLRAAGETGLIDEPDLEPDPNTHITPNPNPNDPGYVTRESVQEMLGQTLGATGDIVAKAYDAMDQYRELFGKSMPGGLSQLRADFQEAQRRERFTGDIVQFAESRYKFADKRQEIADKQVQDRIDAQVKEKVAAEERRLKEMYGSNPNLTVMRKSNAPFTNVAASGGKIKSDGSITQPWEKTPAARRQERVSKFQKIEAVQ